MKNRINYTGKGTVFLLVILCAVLWGSAYPVVKLSYQLFGLAPGDVPTRILLAGCRFTLAGAGLLITSAALGQKIRPPRQSLGDIGLLSIFQTIVQYSLYYIGLMQTQAAKSAIINQSSNFMVALAAGFFFQEDRLTVRKMVGISIGFFGVIVANMGAGGGFHMAGEGLLLISAVSATAGYLISKRAGARCSPMLLTGWQQLIGGVVLLAIGLATGGCPTQISWSALLSLLYLAFVAAAAYSVWTKLLSENEVARISSYKFLVPIFGTLCSGLLLGEQIWNLPQMLSLILVALGIVILSPKRELKT